MQLYAALTKEGDQVMAVTAERDVLDPKKIRKCLDGLPMMRPLLDMLKPAYDPKTQKLVGPQYVIRAAAVERHYGVAELSGEEIAQIQKRTIDAEITPIAMAVFREMINRVRKIEGNAPLTVEQFRAWVLTLTE